MVPSYMRTVYAQCVEVYVYDFIQRIVQVWSHQHHPKCVSEVLCCDIALVMASLGGKSFQLL